jgi:hypothetical protein
VLDAITAAYGLQRRTPGRYSNQSGALVDALAKHQGAKPENIVLGCGSTQILRSCTHLFTAKDKALVGTIPTYEECAGYADMMGNPVRAVPLDQNFNADLDRLADAARGAGLIFFCNPNNPVATYAGARATRDFLSHVNRISPETTIPWTRRISITSPIPITPRTSRKPSRTAHHRRADLLEGVRHGGSAHRLRGGSPDTIGRWRTGRRIGHELAERAVDACRDGRDQQDMAFITRARAQQGGPRLHDEVVRRSRHDADRLAGQLHVREHRPSSEGLPRGLRQAGCQGRARLPAVREDALPHLLRHDGRNEEGGHCLRRRAPKAWRLPPHESPES